MRGRGWWPEILAWQRPHALTIALLPFAYAVVSPDPCIKGWQLPDSEPDSFACECASGYTGDTCELQFIGETACQNGALEVKTGSISCVCDPGYTGDECTELDASADPCEGISCSLVGSCVVGEDGLTATCECEDGYGGDNCENTLPVCTYEYLMDLTTEVDFYSRLAGAGDTGLDCKYFIALLWTDMYADMFTGLPGFCTCMDWLLNHRSYWAHNLGCVIEEEFPLSLQTEWDTHCPDMDVCNDHSEVEMKAAIQNLTPECDTFVSHRPEMPLSWRTPMKCSCLLSLGISPVANPDGMEPRDRAAELIYCPFTAHAASTDMVAYDNCASDEVEICHFSNIKDAIRTNLEERYPPGVEICSNAMVVLAELTPESDFFTYLPDNWCPCYDVLAQYWAEGLDLIDCNAVTFYEFTIKELMQMYCFDQVYIQRETLWDIYSLVVPVASYVYEVGVYCYTATVMTANAPLDSFGRERLIDLVCTCIRGIALVNNNYNTDYHSYMDTINPHLKLRLGISGQDCFMGSGAHSQYQDIRRPWMGEPSPHPTTMGLEYQDDYHPIVLKEVTASPSRDYTALNITLGVLTGLLTLFNSYTCCCMKRRGEWHGSRPVWSGGVTDQPATVVSSEPAADLPVVAV